MSGRSTGGTKQAGGGSGGTGRRCPICARPAAAAFDPFCSRRCADVDLHRWLGGHYAIPAAEVDGGDAEDAGEAPVPPIRDDD